MKKFDSDDKSLRDVFSEAYTLPYYQREYTWDTAQVQDLLDDFIAEFSEYYKPGDTPEQVGNYGYYFLGSIIVDSKKNLVDGQQRLTTISLLLLYLYHRLKYFNIEFAIQVKGLAYLQRFGTTSAKFVIDTFDRHETMLAILNNPENLLEDVQGSAAIIQKRYRDIETLFPKWIDNDMLTVFSTWVGTNVKVVMISAENGTDAYRIFSTQNDRGKVLSKMDMLKADIISNIADERQEERNETWKSIIATINESGIEPLKKDVPEDELVMSLLLQAHYAQEIVTQAEMKAKDEKHRSAMESDFVRSRANPYKWVLSNKKQMGLSTSDDYCRFIDEFRQCAEAYIRIRKVLDSKHAQPGLENLYRLPPKYVSNLFISVMLAPLKLGDTVECQNKKINLVARFVDIFVSKYCFKRWGLNETNYEYLFDELIKNMRGKPLYEIKYHLYRMIVLRSYCLSDYAEDIDELEYPEGRKNKRYKELKWILARITAYMEVIDGKEDLTHAYLDADYHIEHIIPDHEERWGDYGLANKDEFPKYRNNIASLLLLKGSINSGLGDKPFETKKSTYNSTIGNTYASTLSFDETYMSTAVRNLAASGVPFKSYYRFDKAAIAHRKIVINELCKRIWNTDDFALTEAEKEKLEKEYGPIVEIEQESEDEALLEDNIDEQNTEESWDAYPYPSGIYYIEARDKTVIMKVRIEEYNNDSRSFIIKAGSLVSPRKQSWQDRPMECGITSIIRYEAEKLGVVGSNYKLKTDVIFDVPSAAESFGYGSSHDGAAFRTAYLNGNYVPLDEDFPSGGTRNKNNYLDYPQYIEIEKLLTDKAGKYRNVYTKRLDSYVNIFADKGMRLVASIEPHSEFLDVWFYLPIDDFGCYGPELTDFSAADAPDHHTSGKTRLRIPNDGNSSIPLFEKYFEQVLAEMRR